jgi:anti-sigma B factor antagonist
MEVLALEDKLGYTIKIVGDVDASSSIVLDNALEQAMSQSQGHIFVDCTELDYISSPGIGAFTSRLSECERTGRRIILYGVNHKVMNVFQVLGLHKLLPLYATKDELRTIWTHGTSD